MNDIFSAAETIAAIASAPGSGLRGIIRISGMDVRLVLSKLLAHGDWQQATDAMRLPTRLPVEIPLIAGSIRLPAQLLFWPTRRSFTGEPLAELHVVGSPPLVNEVLGQALVCGARPAERGEFTLRAFLAGRIDLVQAEAVLGVIDAGNTAELKTALAQLAGGISSRIAEVREELLLHLADLEAGLDFVEEDIEFVQRDELERRLVSARELLTALLQQASDRMVSHGRLKVVLAGLPNAGKSTLFNAVLGRHAALVSSVAGTTRDYLSAAVETPEMVFDLVDTAGWEQARDGIEAAAGDLRSDQLERAHLTVWCSAADLTAEEHLANATLRDACRSNTAEFIEIWTKVDRAPHQGVFPANSLLQVSAETGQGVELLLRAITSRLSVSTADTELIGATAARCQESLGNALTGIERALGAMDAHAGDELISVELRDVLESLGRIVGKVYTDDILDRIFSRFCIGK